MKRIRPTTAKCFQAIQSPALYRNFGIHLFVMFPAAMAMCWLGTQLDSTLGYVAFGTTAWRFPVGGTMVAIGGLWVWYVYGYLFIAGGGSPGTHVDGGPVRLVDTGPYATIRHPSVLGKLLGVIGLGIMWGSPSFLLGFIPVLLTYAIISNRLIQERFCHLRFGAEYTAYCSKVPMLIPTSTSISRWTNDIPVLEEVSSIEEHPQPDGIWHEFRWYLMGLIGLLLGFSTLVWLNG